MDKKNLGIYSFKDKIFYYLETGPIYVQNTIDRLRKTLIKRNLITLDGGTHGNTDSFKIMSITDALAKEYKLVAIPISKFVKEVLLGKDKEKDTTGWDAKKKGKPKKKDETTSPTEQNKE